MTAADDVDGERAYSCTLTPHTIDAAARMMQDRFEPGLVAWVVFADVALLAATMTFAVAVDQLLAGSLLAVVAVGALTWWMPRGNLALQRKRLGWVPGHRLDTSFGRDSMTVADHVSSSRVSVEHIREVETHSEFVLFRIAGKAQWFILPGEVFPADEVARVRRRTQDAAGPRTPVVSGARSPRGANPLPDPPAGAADRHEVQDQADDDQDDAEGGQDALGEQEPEDEKDQSEDNHGCVS